MDAANVILKKIYLQNRFWHDRYTRWKCWISSEWI